MSPHEIGSSTRSKWLTKMLGLCKVLAVSVRLGRKAKEAKMPRNDRYVVNHPDGWAVRASGAQRASSVHDTQAEAIMVARNTVMRSGGGEVRIQGRDGRWRDSDTVAPGNDPFPPRDMR